MKKKTHLIGGIAGAALVAVGWIAFCGYQWSWGPFERLHNVKMAGHPGNAAQYTLETVAALSCSPLEGKRIVFLGSSVTYGAASMGVSFPDYIAARSGCISIKEAVSGTTLTDSGTQSAVSYIARMKKLDTEMAVNLFVCQLSTNDATQNKPLGNVCDSFDPADFDTSTVAGAIEYIIAYARQTWDCPVVFYTNPRYDSESYAAMVELLAEIAEKWDISVIDLWNDEAFDSITEEQRVLYMADAIHPTQAGYLEWWTPYMELFLIKAVQ